MAASDVTVSRQDNYPGLPYLGLRPFNASDRLLYRGRTVDLDTCLSRLESAAVRVLVIQGLSGSGKSSFLRAGLVPALQESNQHRIVPVCPVVPAGPDMFQVIARQIYTYIIQGEGRASWPANAEILQRRYPEIEDFVAKVSDKVEVLIDFLSELSENPRKSALIAIDQVEDLWSMPAAAQSQAVRDKFFRLVCEFALERLNGRLVLAIRTEHYGIFASRLPDSTIPAYASVLGVNRLCHHYLANPLRDDLVALVKHPTRFYDFSFEDGLPESMVDELGRLAQQPEMCVLPLLQVVLVRLYIEGRRDVGTSALTISKAAYRTLLQAADGSSTGLLDEFVRWGLTRAVRRVFEEEGLGDQGLLRQGIEVERWFALLKEMSDGTSGARVGVRQSLADIERIAEKLECEAHVTRMIDCLVDPEIGLLAKLDNPRPYALRHDLIRLTFDHRAESPSPEFWQQTVDDQRARIYRAAGYTLQDLFGDEPPSSQKLRVAELRFWDHKMLAYATYAGFFERLGFNVEPVRVAENVSATELVDRLTDGHDCRAVFSFPRSLMSVDERRLSRDVVVLNSFTGFAVICNSAAGLRHFEDGDSWADFENNIDALLALPPHRAVYLAEDQGAKDFFGLLLEIAQLCKGPKSHSAIEAMSALTTHSKSAGPEILERMLSEHDQPCVAIVTAPTWATARIVGDKIITVFDHRSLLHVLDQIPDSAKSAYVDVRRKLKVRNVMNIHLEREAEDSDLESILMRLASIGLFLSARVWASETDVCEWIRTRWIASGQSSHSHGGGMSAKVFMPTFRRSYHYTTANEHGDLYFGAEWPDDCASALIIHQKLILAKMSYQEQTASLTGFEASASVPEDVRLLVERARRHAEIFNYFDARRLLDQAMQKLTLQVSSG